MTNLMFDSRGLHGQFPSLSDLIDAFGDCWEWKGSLSDGYGQTRFQGRDWRTHVLVWTLLVGNVPDGLELDHLCQNKACCNPDHLEPVTHQTNVERAKGRHLCPNGHRRFLWRLNRNGGCKDCDNERHQRLRLNNRHKKGICQRCGRSKYDPRGHCNQTGQGGE